MTILVSIFDKKAVEYQPPLAFPNLASVMRSYTSAFQKNPQAQICQFPEDFDLFVVGEFQEVSGTIVPVQPPSYIESLINLNPNHDLRPSKVVGGNPNE